MPRQTPAVPRPLQVDEFAEHCGLDRKTVIRAIERGEIRASRVGRKYLIPASEQARLSGVPAPLAAA